MTGVRRSTPTAARSWAGAVLLGSLIAVAGPLQAQTTRAAAPVPVIGGTGPAWSALTSGQRSVLAPLEQEWPKLDASRKAKWLVVASRLPSMPEADRGRVQARMAEWARLTPAERGRARQNFQELRALGPDDRQALWEAYRALPEEQKREFAQRATPAASHPAAGAQEARTGPSAKRNIVATPPQPVVKPVAPTVVQVKPGATTTLVTRPATPPVHHQTGLPKITASEGFVNPATLLPNRGPQGAAMRAANVASGPTAQQ